MNPTTDEEPDRTPDTDPDDAEISDGQIVDGQIVDDELIDDEISDAEITDEVPIVTPAAEDEQAIADSPVGAHIATEQDVAAQQDDAAAATAGQETAAAAQETATAATAGQETATAAQETTAADTEDPARYAEDTAGGAEDTADDTAPADAGEWSSLTPLAPDDLAALDPTALESDLDDEGEIVDLVEPSDVGPASTRTADELTSDTILRVTSRPPQSGWRRFVYEITGGLVRPNLSRSERARIEQLGLIRTLVTQPRRITVVSRKGGVGKTTTTLMLGQTLASERGDRIIAVDGNPDAGNLGHRVGDLQAGSTSITDLLNEMGSIRRYADMRRYTVQTGAGLEVLMSDDDPHISTALGEPEYTAVMSLLDRFYNLVLVDTGTGILDSAVQGILDGTDQIVLVVAPSLDAARAASQTLDWLTEHGFVELVETAVTVINQVRSSALVDIARIEEHFWDRCGATVRIPWDRYLEAGAETDLADLRPATREAYLQLAAAVARRFET